MNITLRPGCPVTFAKFRVTTEFEKLKNVHSKNLNVEKLKMRVS